MNEEKYIYASEIYYFLFQIINVIATSEKIDVFSMLAFSTIPLPLFSYLSLQHISISLHFRKGFCNDGLGGFFGGILAYSPEYLRGGFLGGSFFS